MVQPVFVYFLTVLGAGFAITDYCSVNNFKNNDENYMQFTKEPSFAEYAVVGKFKGLHCCAKAYRSIEWFKDGRPYPWPGTASQLIIYPENANQTVYTQSVTPDDAGNYTCLLRNDSVVHVHTIQLQVFDKVPDDPKITYISNDVEVAQGQPARLFCEAFVGLVDLPDAHNEAIWRKIGQNGTLDDEPRIRQEKVSREDGQTFGTYLIIEEVTDDDYGEYVCRITKPGKTVDLPSVLIFEKAEEEYLNANPFPWKRLIIWGTVLTLLMATILILNLQFGMSLRVWLKDRLGRIEEEDGKINDVLVVYSQKDSELVLGVLVSTMDTKYQYKCDSKELSENIIAWTSELSEAAQKSRRVVAVVSPALVNDKWDASSLYQTLKQLQGLGPKTCFVVLQKMPNCDDQAKNAIGENLNSILRNATVIQWERSNDRQFWLALRLNLPPRRIGGNVLNAPERNATRLNSDETVDNVV
ncbi:interleukin-1 receptor accessory protein-like 1 [Agrilus planipennis]|uniref:Soluble interferon alpha/beta receptor OPG204 n=1 Tax=Agrilus planipennis TaxID=224129 RepID=A0A1W4WX96_AGRPL|nr:interleukin-1 receptor accessory protein-like 1 [Agrilus planipennis]